MIISILQQILTAAMKNSKKLDTVIANQKFLALQITHVEEKLDDLTEIANQILAQVTPLPAVSLSLTIGEPIPQ